MASANDRLSGVYKINAVDFPVPITSWQEDEALAAGLNGIPILSSYKVHTWTWSQLEASYAELLYSIFSSQQVDNLPVSLETDPYDASGANAKYGTLAYDDTVILSVGSRTRGMPTYDDVTVRFEVYVP